MCIKCTLSFFSFVYTSNKVIYEVDSINWVSVQKFYKLSIKKKNKEKKTYKLNNVPLLSVLYYIKLWIRINMLHISKYRYIKIYIYLP